MARFTALRLQLQRTRVGVETILVVLGFMLPACFWVAWTVGRQLKHRNAITGGE